MDEYFFLSLIAIIVLILCSAFISGTETALTAVSRPLIHQMVKEGRNKRAQILEKLLSKKERLISALLLANNLINVLAASVATAICISLWGDKGIFIATLLMTGLLVIFAEVLPKTYAINNPLRPALFSARLIYLLILVLSPFVRLVEWIVGLGLRLFVGADSSTLGISETELRGALELHSYRGDEERQERTMMKSILDLDETEVSDVMIHRKDLFTIDADLELEEIIKQIKLSKHSRVPLWREDADNIIGILHAKNLLMLEDEASHRIDIEELCSKPWFIPSSTSLLQQLHAFRERREHFALVVDEYGKLKGMVTLEDILEEIVGDISDEFDRGISGIKLRRDGSVISDGEITVRDLNRRFDWYIPDDTAATIAGFIQHEARELPEVGRLFNFHGYRFKVLERKFNRISRVEIRSLDNGSASILDKRF